MDKSIIKSGLLLIVTFLIISLIASCSERVLNRPNVILIITDDQGYGDIAVHGNPVIRTPSLDRLHDESIRFTDFHVAPMCSPTRGQLMTGWDAMRSGCTAVCEGRSMPHSDLPTMADFFENAGYATGHFGKWHLGESYPYRPQDRGFQETIHHRGFGITSLPDYWGNTYFDPVLNHNGVNEKFKGYCTDIFFDEAIRWMEGCIEKGRPFFAYLPTNTPHGPDMVEEKYSDPYEKIHQYQGIEVPAVFYGMITNIDDNLLKLDKFLQEKKIKGNTILIFMTDNGTTNGNARRIFNGGMKGMKTSTYEGGHRVPCYIRWPDGGIRQGEDHDELTVVQDILPTLIELCNLNDGKAVETDGMSLAGILKDRHTSVGDRKKVLQYRFQGKDGKWDNTVVMWNKWRLIGGDELYDLRTDVHQDHNVAEKFPDVVKDMSEYYDEWYSEAGELYKRKRFIIVGSEHSNPAMLFANDWTGDYCDYVKQLYYAEEQGHFNIEVERSGEYEIRLYRWPPESNLALASDDHDGFYSGYYFLSKVERSSAIPVSKAQLKIADEDIIIDTDPADRYAEFNLHLNKGRYELTPNLLDKNGEILCSAMFVRVLRK